MSGTVKRTLKNGGTIDQGGLTAIEHNAYSGAKKILQAGPEFSPVTGQDASTASGLPIALGTNVWFYNNSSTVAWVAMANTGVAPAAPSSFATGIPLPPNAWFVLNSGENNVIRTSAATVGVYIPKDDAVYQHIPIP